MTSLALVLLKLLAIALPLGGLAWAFRIFPRPRLVYLALLPSFATALLFTTPEAVWLILAIDMVLLILLLVDLLSLPRRKSFSATREAGRIVSLGKPHKVTVTLINHRSRRRTVCLRDGVPRELHPQPEQFTFTAGPSSRSILRYELRAGRRGAFVLREIHLRAVSRLGLWQRMLSYPAETRLNVYPDMKQLGQYAMLARTNRLSLLGVRRTRRIGQDHDFERLRDYTVDDNHKHIDWRATARRMKLTVRDYQSSQSQQIVFLLDCGRMMTNESAGLSLLDHGLNAMLMLSYVALRQGDSVGLICFSDEIHGFIPPRSGMNQMNRLLHASFDRFPKLCESRYDQAFRYLASHCRKRSLVVLVTNVIDEVNANQIERYLSNLVGRHLPLGILLRDRRLFEAVEAQPPGKRNLWTAAAAAEILGWRHQVLTDLQSKGVMSLDVFPEQMTAPLVNRYLEIKARHLL
ncbi:MAG: DUF58 domain-containing protein [Thermoguttaceae bacterium]